MVKLAMTAAALVAVGIGAAGAVSAPAAHHACPPRDGAQVAGDNRFQRLLVDRAAQVLRSCARATGEETELTERGGSFYVRALDVTGPLVAYNDEPVTDADLTLLRVRRVGRRPRLLSTASIPVDRVPALVRVAADGWLVYTACSASGQEDAPDGDLTPVHCAKASPRALSSVLVVAPHVRGGTLRRAQPGRQVASARGLDPWSLRLDGRRFSWRANGVRQVGFLPG